MRIKDSKDSQRTHHTTRQSYSPYHPTKFINSNLPAWAPPTAPRSNRVSTTVGGFIGDLLSVEVGSTRYSFDSIKEETLLLTSQLFDL